LTTKGKLAGPTWQVHFDYKGEVGRANLACPF